MIDLIRSGSDQPLLLQMSSNRLHNQLQKFSEHISSSVTHTYKEKTTSSRYATLAVGTGGELVHNSNGSFCLIKREYQQGYRHGSLQLTENFLPSAVPLSNFTVQENDECINLEDVLFFDTETTGLGGTGVVPFLVGFGSFVGSSFEIRQYLLPDYTDEAGMLESIAEELQGDKTLVSYNGSAFDLPLIRDRFIVNRIARDVPYEHHIDLLHSTRRLFRKRLADCSLTNIERELFAFHRVDDIAGYLVPAVYFDWLHDQSLENMRAVLEHNRLDIVSLAFLLSMTNEILNTDGESLSHVDDLHSLSRLYYRRRHGEKALQLNRKVRVRAEFELDPKVQLYHAEVFKRANELAEAVKLWMTLFNRTDRVGLTASIELSKYFEHQVSDIQKALDFAKLASNNPNISPSCRGQVDHRISRLLKKLQKR